MESTAQTAVSRNVAGGPRAWGYWSLGALILALSFGVGSQVSADAYVLNGCKFPGSNPQIVYVYWNVTSTWQSAFNTAQAAWDTETPGWGGWFASGTSENIPVFDGGYAGSWWGLASGGCDSGGGETWYNLTHCPGSNPCVKIQFNTNTTGGMNATERAHIAVHELGHALGLAHSSLGCSNPVVMRSDATWVYDNCGLVVPPWQNDLDGVDAIY